MDFKQQKAVEDQACRVTRELRIHRNHEFRIKCCPDCGAIMLKNDDTGAEKTFQLYDQRELYSINQEHTH